ncbi:hypothetical protein [Kitasatospora camelliae]|uniref:LPXTG-motif cell wall-anchored protein n=1 Tax=Kitasatospora camelliae TaxID=3156397 RepID=A0AAU8JUL0_9ACTN
MRLQRTLMVGAAAVALGLGLPAAYAETVPKPDDQTVWQDTAPMTTTPDTLPAAPAPAAPAPKDAKTGSIDQAPLFTDEVPAETKAVPKVEPKAVEPKAAEPKVETKAGTASDGKAEAKTDAKPESKPEAKTEAKPEARTEAKPEAKADDKAEAKSDAQHWASGGSWEAEKKPRGGVHTGGGGLAVSGGGLASGAALLAGGLGVGAYALRRRRSAEGAM